MSRRTSEASNAIRKAWENERQLVSGGKGTRDWTKEQQRDILDKGKAYDNEGKAFEGHHMKSAEAYPDYQGNPDNIQFLTRTEHKDAHCGNFQNPTNGYFKPTTHETVQFAEDELIHIKKIDLTDPINIPEKNDHIPEESGDSENDKEGGNETRGPTEQHSNVEQDTDHTPHIDKPQMKAAPQQNIFGNIGQFFVDHKDGIINGLKIAGKIGLVVGGTLLVGHELSKNLHSNNSLDDSLSDNSDDSFSSYDRINEESYDSEEENLEESSDQEDRPYTENDVPPHRQRYGKDKHWVDKEGYHRKGKDPE